MTRALRQSLPGRARWHRQITPRSGARPRHRRSWPSRFFAADELIDALSRALADNTVGRLIGSLLRNDLVIIDDLGFTAPYRNSAESSEIVPLPLRRHVPGLANTATVVPHPQPR